MPPPSASAIAADALRATPRATAQRPGAPQPQAQARGARRTLRVLLLTDTAISVAGGSERFLRNLLLRLPRERYRITVVQLLDTRYAGTRVAIGPEFDHVTLIDLPVAAVYGRGGRHALSTLRAMARTSAFDVVQSQHESSDLLNALLPARPGQLRISCRRDMGFGKSAKLKWLFRHLNPRFDAVVAPSPPILADLARSEALDPARTQCIANGVDTDRFRPMDAATRRSARLALGIADDEVALVCVARLSAEKCHDDLLQAFAGLHAGQLRTRLFLVGDGPLQSQVEARRAALGLERSVTLAGLRLDVERLLPAFDLGVLASSTEGMSNALLEAMACGLPVVATSVGGNPTLVEHGVTGLLVPARHPGRLAAALMALAADAGQRHRMGTAARARIEQAYSVQAMADAFDDLYHRRLDAR